MLKWGGVIDSRPIEDPAETDCSEIEATVDVEQPSETIILEFEESSSDCEEDSVNDSQENAQPIERFADVSVIAAHFHHIDFPFTAEEIQRHSGDFCGRVVVAVGHGGLLYDYGETVTAGRWPDVAIEVAEQYRQWAEDGTLGDNSYEDVLGDLHVTITQRVETLGTLDADEVFDAITNACVNNYCCKGGVITGSDSYIRAYADGHHWFDQTDHVDSEELLGENYAELSEDEFQEIWNYKKSQGLQEEAYPTQEEMEASQTVTECMAPSAEAEASEAEEESEEPVEITQIDDEDEVNGDVRCVSLIFDARQNLVAECTIAYEYFRKETGEGAPNKLMLGLAIEKATTAGRVMQPVSVMVDVTPAEDGAGEVDRTVAIAHSSQLGMDPNRNLEYLISVALIFHHGDTGEDDLLAEIEETVNVRLERDRKRGDILTIN